MSCQMWSCQVKHVLLGIVKAWGVPNQWSLCLLFVFETIFPTWFRKTCNKNGIGSAVLTKVLLERHQGVWAEVPRLLADAWAVGEASTESHFFSSPVVLERAEAPEHVRMKEKSIKKHNLLRSNDSPPLSSWDVSTSPSRLVCFSQPPRKQIGNPEGEEKPNKKYYDPRACIRSAEESTVKRHLDVDVQLLV